MSDNPAPANPSTETSPSSSDGKHHKRHHHHHHHHHRRNGQTVVLAAILLVTGYLTTALVFSIKGNPHPLLETWGYTTQLVMHCIVAPVILLCLFRFYRGSVSIKQVMGAVSSLTAVGYAILITLDFLQDDLQSWILLDALGLAISVFVAWVCFFSRGASSFLNYQQDHP